jgi:probable F420-dependent oxidoreductase
MTASRLGITIPFEGPLAEHPAVFDQLRAAGYAEFWTAETARTDAFTPLAYAAALAPTVGLGTAIASVFVRGPAMLAMNAAALAEAAPGRFTLGIGASSPALVRDWNSVPFVKPLSRVRDSVRFLRSALAGEKVDAEYDTFTVRGFRLERPPTVPPPIMVGALGPQMLRLAATEADGAILNWLSAGDVTLVAGEMPPGTPMAARIFVSVSEDTDVVRSAARRLIAGYLTVPAYERFHRWLGRDAALEPMWRNWAAGDRKAAAASVPDEVADALFVHGDAARCAAHLRRYIDAGIAQPIVKMLPLDPSRDLVADAVALASALR